MCANVLSGKSGLKTPSRSSMKLFHINLLVEQSGKGKQMDLSKNFLNSFLLHESGSLVQPIIVTLKLSSMNLPFHLARVFLMRWGAFGSFFAFFPFLPFFLAGHTFSASSIQIIDGQYSLATNMTVAINSSSFFFPPPKQAFARSRTTGERSSTIELVSEAIDSTT